VTTPEPPVPDDPRLIELAYRVTDDAPVDWEITRQSASDLGETLERLRQLQTIGELNRRRGETAPATPPRFRWGPLRAIEKLGEGGFGEVWRAWDPALQREVALKLRREPGGAAETRWLREAQRLARVRHPHVLTVHGTDVHDGRAGLWTDLIHGRTLEQLLLEHGPFGAREVTAIGLDLCAALAAVHGAGLVHGDVKTRNVMREGLPVGTGSVAGAGRIVLMDFGTASEQAEDGPAGMTPLFAAPELLEGGSPDVLTDLYALGVLLYRLASGHFPIEAASLAELRSRHRAREATPLRTWRPDLPGPLVQVIERAISPDPTQRFANAAEMERALAAVTGPAVTPRAGDGAGRWRFAAGMLSGVLVAALAWAGYQALRDRNTPRFHMGAAPRIVPHVLEPLVPETALGQWGGYASLAIGDIDGDGHPDLAAASPWDHEGRVRILFGDGHGGFPRTLDLVGNPHRLLFGSALAVGDLDGDGHPDLVVAAPGPAPSYSGSVMIFRGGAPLDTTPALVLHEPRPNGWFGYSVTTGDWNGDGIPDIAVGAQADKGGGKFLTGRVYVYFGGRHMHTSPDIELGCDTPEANFGTTVDLGGDLNGDGFADLAVGAQWEATDGPRAGRTYVYYGGRAPSTKPGLVLRAPGPWHLFGPARYVGDLDGDGFDDLLVTDEHGDGFEHGSGAAMLYRGSGTPATTPALVFKGEHENDGFGRWATRLDDVTGDGRPDLAIGAWWSDAGGPTSGAVYVYAGGPRMRDEPLLVIPGPGPEARFGTGVTSSGDLDGDGFPELLIGAPSQSRTLLGGLYVARFHRYVLHRPRDGETWVASEPVVVGWSGADPARLEWSPDGAHWQPWIDHTGGHAENIVHAAPPAGAHGVLRVRVVPVDTRVRGEAVSPAITLVTHR
jgi:tRNA A-37 threonylcarbamoyl transferase component Bud32